MRLPLNLNTIGTHSAEIKSAEFRTQSIYYIVRISVCDASNINKTKSQICAVRNRMCSTPRRPWRLVQHKQQQQQQHLDYDCNQCQSTLSHQKPHTRIQMPTTNWYVNIGQTNFNSLQAHIHVRTAPYIHHMTETHFLISIWHKEYTPYKLNNSSIFVWNKKKKSTAWNYTRMTSIF